MTIGERTLRSLLGAAILLSLAGCIPVAIGAAGAALGGGRPTAANMGGGNNKMTAGHDVQHGRPADRSVADALQQSEGEVSEGCRSRLPDVGRPDPTRTCQARWVCLPGARAPMRLHVCEAAGPPDSLTVPASARVAAWRWNDKER